MTNQSLFQAPTVVWMKNDRSLRLVAKPNVIDMGPKSPQTQFTFEARDTDAMGNDSWTIPDLDEEAKIFNLKTVLYDVLASLSAHAAKVAELQQRAVDAQKINEIDRIAEDCRSQAIEIAKKNRRQ